MKKVTVILSMFVIGFTSNAFAQNSPSTKISNGTKDANPILIGLLLPAVKDNNAPAKTETKAPAARPGAGGGPHVKVFDGATAQPAAIHLPAVQKAREQSNR